MPRIPGPVCDPRSMHRLLPRSVLLPAVLFGSTGWLCLNISQQFASTAALKGSTEDEQFFDRKQA